MSSTRGIIGNHSLNCNREKCISRGGGGIGESILPIVFGFLGYSRSLHHPEDFFVCLPIGHSLCMKVKDQLIHERIRFGELRCVHS